MRTLIWTVIFMLLVYVLLQLYQIWFLKYRSPQPVSGTAGRHGADDEYMDIESSGAFLYETLRPEPDMGQPAPAQASALHADEESVATGEPVKSQYQNFQAEFEIQQLRQELLRLRTEIMTQREAIGELILLNTDVVEQRTELAAVKEQLDALATAQNVSPEYIEALVLARKGMDANTIAEHCGISVAEAETVQMLAQRNEA